MSTHARTALSRGGPIVLSGAFGIVGVVLFHHGIYLPVYASAAVVVLVTWYLIAAVRRSRIGPLSLVLFVGYALPFIHIVPYIWFDFDAPSPLVLWGLLANPYMVDRRIIELMSMMGAVGAAGFMAGTAVLYGKLPVVDHKATEALASRPRRTLSMPFFLIWIGVAIILSWIKAPSETLLVSTYGASAAAADNWNFGSAWMISAAFLLFAHADAMFDPSPTVGKLKRRIVLVTFVVIVVWLQLLRGDREALPCVLGALLMYYVWGQSLVPGKKSLKGKGLPLLLGVLAIGAVSFFVAALRSRGAGLGVAGLFGELMILSETDLFRFDNLIHGTWSAVLLTPLSTAGKYLSGELSLAYGKTYVDFVASIVPGFVADAIGYVRPIDALRGPSYEMTYGMGGTHAVVVPFMNFRMAGIFLVIALWSFAFAKLERHSMKRVTVANLALLGLIVTAIPHWLWYGEKNIMTTLMIWLILAVLYRLHRVRRGVPPADVSFSSARLSSAHALPPA
jgi:hypothetical protein